MKILIAEDDAVDLQLLQLTLERMGHEVVVTRTGTEAWETFDRAPVRVVVSDWMIPGLDGLEFCHRVRTRPNTPYTYFILLTALGASAENYVLATEAGIDDSYRSRWSRSRFGCDCESRTAFFGSREKFTSSSN